MNIICIEPDVVLARQYKKVLGGHNAVTVRLCLDPQVATHLIDEQKPDVIIMELQLAPLSGFAFINELRSYEDLSTIPIVIYSSVPKESFAVSAQTWQSLGVERYFYKAKDSVHKVAQFVLRETGQHA